MTADPFYRVDPSELPRYSIVEAARDLGLSRATLRSWVSGRSYETAGGKKRWEALIDRPDPGDSRLSFSNLVEAHVLNALRKQYRVRMREVRRALDYAQERLGVGRVLLSRDLRVTPGNLFLRHLEELINLGKGGQKGIPDVLDAYLERIDWDRRGLPARIFPLTRVDLKDAPKLVTIDPKRAFGRPILERKAIRTASIAARFKAGESLREIAADYDLEAFEVEEALRYEAPALAA